jgi:cell division protein FtsB
LASRPAQPAGSQAAPPRKAGAAAKAAKPAKPAGRQGKPGGPSGPPRAPRARGEQKPERAPEPWFRSIRMSGFTVVILGLVMLTVVVLAPSLRILIEQRQTIAALQAVLDEKQQSVAELQKDVARWQDPAYIEAQARERLYYVYPGEYSYLVIDDTGAHSSTGDVPISTDIQTTRVDWVKSLLSSLYTAGLTDATPADLQAPEIGG